VNVANATFTWWASLAEQVVASLSRRRHTGRVTVPAAERAPLTAAASAAAALLVLVAVPPVWAAVSWLAGRPGPEGVLTVLVLLDGLLLLAAGAQTWWRPATWWPWATAGGLLLGALQWVLELAAGTPSTWQVSGACAVVLVWFVLDRVPRPAPAETSTGT
jgi:hypothetical protein